MLSLFKINVAFCLRVVTLVTFFVDNRWRGMHTHTDRSSSFDPATTTTAATEPESSTSQTRKDGAGKCLFFLVPISRHTSSLFVRVTSCYILRYIQLYPSGSRRLSNIALLFFLFVFANVGILCINLWLALVVHSRLWSCLPSASCRSTSSSSGSTSIRGLSSSTTVFGTR